MYSLSQIKFYEIYKRMGMFKKIIKIKNQNSQNFELKRIIFQNMFKSILDDKKNIQIKKSKIWELM